MITEPGWRDVLGQSALTFVGVAAFPRLAYRMRWPTRLGPRGLLAYIAFNTLFQFAMRTWALPYLKRRTEEYERARDELMQRLGREPTHEEFADHLGYSLDLDD